jgi:predicted Rossmann-fold nucleotide-binding protein
MVHELSECQLDSKFSAVVAFAGTLGTLTEAAIIWNMALLAPLANEERPMILLYREPWQALMQTIAVALKLGPDVLSCLRYIDTAEEAVDIIAEDYARRTASGPVSGAAAM